MEELIVPVMIIGAILCILFYFTPSFIAFSRKHECKGWVLFLNIFIRWTGLGWFFGLIWAAFGKTDKA
jgi:hypothetical protein